jgi:hypothetical protein
VWILQKHRSRYFAFLFFKQKLLLKSIYILGESCSSCYAENNKIELAIFGFFNNFILNLQVPAEIHKGGRIISRRNPWNFLSLTRLPSTLAARPSNPKNSPQGYPQWRRRLSGGEVGPGLANK